MTVSVANRLIQDPSALSPLGRLSLAFIDGGREWLTWAIAEPTARYDFADETLLLGQVQMGLHATRLALLPNLQLWVSPIKLMTLGLANLRVLAQAEGGDTRAVVAAQVAKILSDHQLARCADLAAGTAWLAELGLTNAPLFQALEFDDRLALWHLAEQSPPSGETTPELRQEAAQFAAAQARAPQEFCDYFRVYLDCAAKRLSATPGERADAAGNALKALLPLLFGTLDCPQIEGLPSPAEVEAAVANWLARGKQVGFVRLSQPVQQIVQHTEYRGDPADDPQKSVRLYLQSAQAFLAATRPSQGRLGQDGATCSFVYEGGSLRAELQVGKGGVISLQDFGRRQPVDPFPEETSA